MATILAKAVGIIAAGDPGSISADIEPAHDMIRGSRPKAWI